MEVVAVIGIIGSYLIGMSPKIAKVKLYSTMGL